MTWIALLGLGAAACGGGTDEPAPSASLSQTQTGAMGVYAFTIEPAAPPAQGENVFTLSLRDMADAAVPGATVAVVTGMPSMGMDGPVVPPPTEVGGGDYAVRDVVFSMGGPWEIACEATRDGATDHVAFTYEVP